jgi:hypothetical protein
VENEQPDFGLIGLAHAAKLPGVRRKLHNLAQRTAAKRAADRGQLAEVLARIKAGSHACAPRGCESRPSGLIPDACAARIERR